MAEYYYLEAEDRDPKRIHLERKKAQKIKKTNWWRLQLEKGQCYHCKGNFSSKLLTMDHLVPLARGGKSTAGNLVPSCRCCNQKKNLNTPVDLILQEANSDKLDY